MDRSIWRREMKKQARILLAAPKSGSGKTLFTCGLLALCKKKQIKVAAMKCGPDYIDPMFHRKVLKVPSGNLDSYFTDEDTLRGILTDKMEQSDLTVIEGVMGFYDGLSGISEKASTYDVARLTKTPVLLVVDGKGASVSLAALIRGIRDYREDSHIAGVLLNRVSPAYYERIKAVIEKECELPVLGYLPELPVLSVPSRHLGLLQPEELAGFDTWITEVRDALEKTVDLEGILAVAETAPELQTGGSGSLPVLSTKVRIALAQDEAFSFFYEENRKLLEKMGAEVCLFSPIHDQELPEETDGLILPGGYPELYAEALSENHSMRNQVRKACEGNMPVLAECGGFLYLQKNLTYEGKTFDMAGALDGEGFQTKSSVRFGYLDAVAEKPGLLGDAGVSIRGHEFHYFDCSNNGDGFTAKKPLSDRSYSCMIYTAHMAAGFPHFYYESNPEMLYSFLRACESYRAGRLAKKHLDSIAKPIDSLGLLEDMVVKLCRIGRSEKPYPLEKRALLVLCADHGVVEEGVAQTDSSVTRVVAENFAKGNSTVNYMAEVAGVDVYPVDAGMKGEYYWDRTLRRDAVADRKIAEGTGNLTKEAAMTGEQCRRALEEGKALVKELKEKGYTILAVGEMGIGNTTPTSVLAGLYLNKDAGEVTGKGAGLSCEGYERKCRAVERALTRIRAEHHTDPQELLAEGGGLEIAMMAGVFLGAVKEEMPVVLDGAISCVAALAAYRIDCRVTDYLLPSHMSGEGTGAMALSALGLQAPVRAGMRLGEGTGALTLFPLLSMAMEVYERMGTFTDYEIRSYERFQEEIPEA